MFEQLFGLMKSTANPFQGFLGELWNIWKRDVGRAVLLARWHWNRLPVGLAAQAAALGQQAQAAQRAAAESRAMNDQLRAQLGALGISPGPNMGFGFGGGPGLDPDQTMFVAVMGQIQAARGDPPVAPGVDRLAERVFQGELDAVQALVESAPPFVRPQLAAAVQLMSGFGMGQFYRTLAIAQMASCLPRSKIPLACPELRRAGGHHDAGP